MKTIEEISGNVNEIDCGWKDLANQLTNTLGEYLSELFNS